MAASNGLDDFRRDPRYDGTILGAGGFVDEEQRKILSIDFLLEKLYLGYKDATTTLLEHFAVRGVTPAMAKRMPLADIERHLREEVQRLDNPSILVNDRLVNTAGPSESAQKKRSTQKGAPRARIIGVLSEHHQYEKGSVLNQEPITIRELARKAKVSPSTASDFFKKQLPPEHRSKGHSAYTQLCRNLRFLIHWLEVLNRDYSPMALYGAAPPAERSSRGE
jgi:hypothetical protein